MKLMLFSTLLIVAISFFISFQSAAKFRKNVILNVTLPQKAQDHPQVRQLITGFKRANRLLFLVALIAATLILVPDEVSSFFLLTALWIGLHLLGENVLLNYYSQKLRDLKVLNEWYVGPTNVVSIDLIVSREKGKMPVSRLWFLPPVAVSLYLFVLASVRGGSFAFAILNLGHAILFYLLWSVSSRERASAYSENTEVNLAVTKISIGVWTLCWTALANIHSLLLLFSALVLQYSSTQGLGSAVTIAIFVTLAGIFFAGSSIRRRQNQILNSDGTTVIVDEDHYWTGGVYNNPHDRRILVEKRVGYGQTMNVGTKKGKFLYYGTLAMVTVLMVGLSFVFVFLDSAEYTLRITDGKVVVGAPLYGFTFSTDDVRSVSLVNSLPHRSRTNGAETSQYAIGHFQMVGYGKSRVYVYKGSPPYIVVELPGLHIFFNTRDAAQTQKIYRELRNAS